MQRWDTGGYDRPAICVERTFEDLLDATGFFDASDYCEALDDNPQQIARLLRGDVEPPDGAEAEL